MSSNKKCKKPKGKTLALNEFLLENTGPPTLPARKTTTHFSWADDVENTYSYETRPKPPLVLPTAPKAAREVDLHDKIPYEPPFTAYISNLPYDAKETEIARLFGDLKITSMRIPKDDRFRDVSKLKGFGYIEFENRDSLINALAFQGKSLRNRHIKIDLAMHPDYEKGRKANRNKTDREEYHSGKDWRGEKRPYDKKKMNERSQSITWRSNNPKPAQYDHRRFNSCMRSDSIDRKNRQTKNTNSKNEEVDVRVRPKLILQPRSKPKETEIDIPTSETEVQGISNADSIFGEARPVDTSARERQIEERLAKEKEDSNETGDSKYIKKRSQFYKHKKNSYSRTYTSKTLPTTGYKSKQEYQKIDSREEKNNSRDRRDSISTNESCN